VQQDELTLLIDKTATLMAQYERRGADIDARLQALGELLQGVTQQLPLVVRASTSDLLQTLADDATNKVREGLDRPMDDYRQGLDTARREVENASRSLAGQISQLQRMHRQLIWKTMIAVVIALALLLGGGMWLSIHYTQVIRNNQLSADLLKAYNSADVTLCGAEGLCANVNTRGARYGDQRQYLPVNPR
jgi:hypothetical protein